jgi:type I restriction enzyme S subunit
MKNWQKKKLGELSKKKDDVVSGPFGSNLKVSDYKNEGIPILRLQNIGKGYFIDKDIKFITETKAEELKYHSFLSGDIALAKLGIPIGKTCIIPTYLKSGIITADIVRIRPDKNVVDYNFLEYYLNTDISVRQLTGNISGATRPRVNLSDVRNIEIFLPALPEQQRIVSILDQTFAAIDKAKENAQSNLQNAKELFESYLQGVIEKKGVGWEEERFNLVCELNPQKKEARHKLKETDMVTFLPMEDLGILNKDIIGIKERQLKDVSGSYTYFADNDVLMAKITPCFENGKIGIARNLINGIGFGSSEYIVFRSKGYVEPDYLYYFLSRNQIRSIGSKLMSGAVGHKRVSKDWIDNYIIHFPTSIKEQKNLVSKLDALSAETKRLEAIYHQKLLDLEELKKSVLQKAFNGEL